MIFLYRRELDDLVQQYNDRIRKVFGYLSPHYICVHAILISHQVAAYWANQKKSDFAVVVQPFFSNASADNFTIDFLSMVSIPI